MCVCCADCYDEMCEYWLDHTDCSLRRPPPTYPSQFSPTPAPTYPTVYSSIQTVDIFNPLTPNDPYSGRTAPITSKRYILYIYSTNISTEYFKHGIYSPFFSLQNAVCFIILTYLAPVLFTFYTQIVLKFKKKYSGAKRLKPFSKIW